MPDEAFFAFIQLSGHVLKLSEGIDEPGEIRLELAVCLLVAWICVYFCVWKGVKSVGKVISSRYGKLRIIKKTTLEVIKHIVLLFATRYQFS